MNKPKIIIGQEADGFTIVVGSTYFSFNQEDLVKDKMIELFTHLGYDDVVYEEWY